jgi:hypothetical protein
MPTPTPNQTIEEMIEKCAEQITSLWDFKDTAGYPLALQKTKQNILQHFDPLIRKAQEVDKLKVQQLKGVAALNRLATWAQQDPTGPWNKLEIQKWVLNQIRLALGQEELPELWQPTSVSLEQERYYLKAQNKMIDARREELRHNLHTAHIDIEQIKSQNAELLKDREMLHTILGIDSTMPLLDALPILTEAVDHLLDDHQCDVHGHEMYRAALNGIKAITAAMAKQEGK